MWLIAVISLLACSGPVPETRAPAAAPPPAEEAAGAQRVLTAAGSWRQMCGLSDAVVVEAQADFAGTPLRVFAARLEPGAGPWPIQSAEGRVPYPPRDPMVQHGEGFISAGSVREIEGGLAIDVQTRGGVQTFEIQATYTPMPEGERCEG